ncbi:MAG: hypothetical protein ACR2QW_20620, partial [bacterium]
MHPTLVTLRFRFVLIGFLLSYFSGLACADTTEEFSTARARQSIEAIEFQIFTAGFQTDKSIEESIRRLGQIRSTLLNCISDHEDELRSTRVTLGESFLAELSEKSELTAEELRANNQIENLNSTISDCRLLLDQNNQVENRLNQLQINLRQKSLGVRKDHLLSNLQTGILGLPGILRQKA